MTKALPTLGGTALAAGLGGLCLQLVRRHNKNAYTIMQRAAELSDKSRYETNDHIVAIEGKYLNGFRFIPQPRRHPGTVVVFGGSEGSPAYEQARALCAQGYEVLSLFFFGQPNQVARLARVPLDQFDEIEAYIHTTIDHPTPITVIGTSKGAEFTAELAAHGYAVDNIVNYAPADHSYPGLDFSSREEKPSFRHRGSPVPFASFRNVGAATFVPMMWDLIISRPPRYRESYLAAARRSDPAAAIDLSGFRGHALFFAGEADAMWQSEIAATTLAGVSDTFEVFTYPGAGHLFAEDIASVGTGWEIMFGGTAAGAAQAYRQSQVVLLDRLARWHGTMM